MCVSITRTSITDLQSKCLLPPPPDIFPHVGTSPSTPITYRVFLSGEISGERFAGEGEMSRRDRGWCPRRGGGSPGGGAGWDVSCLSHYLMVGWEHDLQPSDIFSRITPVAYYLLEHTQQTQHNVATLCCLDVKQWKSGGTWASSLAPIKICISTSVPSLLGLVKYLLDTGWS